MMTKFKVDYPAREFGSSVRSAMDKGQPLQVVILSGWRARLLKKSIEFWPRSQGDVDRLKGAKRHSFVLATYLLFSLFHMHVRAMTFGYHMSYLITENAIEMDYALSLTR